MPEARERFANFVFHRAEILAHDDRFVADAFEGEHAHEIVARSADVGAVPSRCGLGDPVEAEEAHDVIDAERAPWRMLLRSIRRRGGSHRRGGVASWRRE